MHRIVLAITVLALALGGSTSPQADASPGAAGGNGKSCNSLHGVLNGEWKLKGQFNDALRAWCKSR